MNIQKITKLLVEIGLSDGEASIYIAALSLGPTTILKIAEKSKIKRTTIYSVITHLIQKGLLSEQYLGFKKQYVAESPEKLEHILDIRKQKLNTFMPELMGIFSETESESVIKYFRGLDEIKKAYDYILKDLVEDEDYMVIGAQDSWYNLDQDFFQDFIEKRSSLNLKIRIIWSDSKLASKFKLLEREYGQKVKILPKGTVFNTNLVITSKKVLIHQLYGQGLAILVENSGFCLTQKEMFEIMWKCSPEI